MSTHHTVLIAQRVQTLLLVELLLLELAERQLLSDEYLALIVLLLPLLHVVVLLVLEHGSLLFVVVYLLSLLHEYLEAFFLDVLVEFASTLHVGFARFILLFFCSFIMDSLLVLLIIIGLQLTDVLCLLFRLLYFLASTLHLSLQHSNAILQKLTVASYLILDGSSLSEGQRVRLEVDSTKLIPKRI